MAKITTYIPEPSPEYNVDNQRQILQALETLKDQLNFSFQEDLKQEAKSNGSVWVKIRNYSLVGIIEIAEKVILSIFNKIN